MLALSSQPQSPSTLPREQQPPRRQPLWPMPSTPSQGSRIWCLRPQAGHLLVLWDVEGCKRHFLNVWICYRWRCNAYSRSDLSQRWRRNPDPFWCHGRAELSHQSSRDRSDRLSRWLWLLWRPGLNHHDIEGGDMTMAAGDVLLLQPSPATLMGPASSLIARGPCSAPMTTTLTEFVAA